MSTPAPSVRRGPSGAPASPAAPTHATRPRSTATRPLRIGGAPTGSTQPAARRIIGGRPGRGRRARPRPSPSRRRAASTARPGRGQQGQRAQIDEHGEEGRVAGGGRERRVLQRPQGHAFEERGDHAAHHPALGVVERGQGDVLQEERGPEDHEQAVQQPGPVGRGGERVPHQHGHEHVIDDVEEAGLGGEALDHLRGGGEERGQHRHPRRVLETGARVAHQQARHEQPRARHHAQQQHRQHQRHHRRMEELEAAAVRGHAEAARRGHAQEDQGKGERLAHGVEPAGHLRGSRTRIGFRSEASLVMPRSSSARSSSAVRMPRDWSADVEPPVRGQRDGELVRRQPLPEQRVVVVEAAPALPVVAVGDVELRGRVPARGVGAPQGGAGLLEAVGAEELQALVEAVAVDLVGADGGRPARP